MVEPTKHRSRHVAGHEHEAPAALSEHDASLEARIRMKLDRGEPLTAEERAFFARMPADSTLPAEEFQE